MKPGTLNDKVTYTVKLHALGNSDNFVCDYHNSATPDEVIIFPLKWI